MNHISQYLDKYRLLVASRAGLDTVTRSERMSKNKAPKCSKYKYITQYNYDGSTNKVRVLR